MPELPEVETVRRGIADRIAGRRITAVDIHLPRLIKGVSTETFLALLVNQEIRCLERRAKYLLLQLKADVTLVIHLRMTGRLYYRLPQDQPDPYTRVVFHLDNADRLVFADTRTLGTLTVVRTSELSSLHGLNTLGPEPLSERFTVDYLQSVLGRRKGKIKALLLNQELIGGLGNIYVDESLFLAGLHPERLGESLNDSEIAALHSAINAVIDDALQHHGTTFRDYRDSYGKRGSHQHHLRVYGRKGEPCVTCGSPILRIEVGGRGTHFCPQCQK